MGRVICGLQTVQLTVDAFCDTREVPVPNQAEEEVVKDNLILHTLRHHAIIWVKDTEPLLDRIDAVLERLLERGAFAPAHESVVSQRQPVPDWVPARTRV